MSVEIQSNVLKNNSESNNSDSVQCVPRNALFCCPAPVCLNNSPKIVPITAHTNYTNHITAMEPQSLEAYPVSIPDLSNPVYHNSLNSQQKSVDDTIAAQIKSTAAPSSASTSASMSVANEKDQTISGETRPRTPIHINKSKSAQDIRLGVSLRRVTPPKASIAIKKPETPLMNVVLRKVEKKLLEPPKPEKLQNSPPPRKLTTIKAIKPKKTKALNNQNAIVKSKSTNDVVGKQKENINSHHHHHHHNGDATGSNSVKPIPPINLLKARRPPLEIHKIEGDKIIIIRRIPRSKRVQDHSAHVVPASLDQVTL